MYYALRFQVLPGPDVADDAARVADFCRDNGIGEVLLITNAEERFTGVGADEDLWFDTAAAAQASFACPRWRSWLAGHYGRYAGLGLRVLWLENDFR